MPRSSEKQSPKSLEIVAAAENILETEGPDALTMRHLAAAVGIKAPSLYKHFPDKASVEIAIIERGFEEWGSTLAQAVEDAVDPVVALGQSYRSFARQHPHLYRLLTEGELPRQRMRPGVEESAGSMIGEIFGDPELARAAWAFAHGMTILELDNRFPPDADLDAAWESGLRGFSLARQQVLHLGSDW